MDICCFVRIGWRLKFYIFLCYCKMMSKISKMAVNVMSKCYFSLLKTLNISTQYKMAANFISECILNIKMAVIFAKCRPILLHKPFFLLFLSTLLAAILFLKYQTMACKKVINSQWKISRINIILRKYINNWYLT